MDTRTLIRILFAALVCCACARTKTDPVFLLQALPIEVQREWKLHDATVQAADAVPADYNQLGFRACVLAHYRANGTVTVRLFDLPKETAVEAMQNWYSPSAVDFYKGNYFGTAESGSLSGKQLAAFVEDFKQNLTER